MSIFKQRKTKTRLWVAACLLLVGVNIASFALFPRLLAPVAIIVSNLVTLLLAALAAGPLHAVLKESLADEIEKDRALEARVRDLEQENRDLTDRLDTRTQTAALPSSIDYTFKLEQMEFTKKGYIVKEEELGRLDPASYSIPEKKWEAFLDSFRKEPSLKKILYIHKYYYKVSIGIDFGEILYAFDDDRILFYGVKFRRLHDISSELEPDAGDIERCDILRISGEKTEIRGDKDYEDLKDQYRHAQALTVRSGMETEVSDLCRQYSETLHESIKERFGARVAFVESIEEHRDKNWYALRSSSDAGVKEIAANMLMLTTVMNKTRNELQIP